MMRRGWVLLPLRLLLLSKGIGSVSFREGGKV